MFLRGADKNKKAPRHTAMRRKNRGTTHFREPVAHLDASVTQRERAGIANGRAVFLRADSGGISMRILTVRSHRPRTLCKAFTAGCLRQSLSSYNILINYSMFFSVCQLQFSISALFHVKTFTFYQKHIDNAALSCYNEEKTSGGRINEIEFEYVVPGVPLRI